jgi:hypothetical protein
MAPTLAHASARLIRNAAPKPGGIARLSICWTSLLPRTRPAGYLHRCHFPCTTAFLTVTYGPFMTQPSAGRPIALFVGAIVALLMLEHALPTRVEAACGHGSKSKAERDSQAVLDHLEFLSAQPSVHHSVPESPARRPCSGPRCSDGGSSRPDVPIISSVETGERWLCALVCLGCTASGDSWLRPRGASPSPVNRANALERPPRPLPV